ncbi:hypothetical protein [Chryseolinea sp. H1M3-3]|uniref:hypothetical protein n=1 Tax=Chryseolinea sp. H1M3-3 TaxID=3034144 RepID=UPI0023EC1F5E|nr:hypothetical protein [Chryseolinea sp. H1M3-3]
MKSFIDSVKNFQLSDYSLTYYHLFFGALVLVVVLGISKLGFIEMQHLQHSVFIKASILEFMPLTMESHS